MTTERTIPNFYPCFEPANVANLAAYEPLAFNHHGQRIYNPYEGGTDEAPASPTLYGFAIVIENDAPVMVRPHEDGGSIRITGTGQANWPAHVVTRVDAEGRVLATFFAKDIPMAGVTIHTMSTSYISADILKPLYFEFEGDSIVIPYTSECGRFEVEPLYYGFELDASIPDHPVMTRPHEDDGKLVLSFVAPVDGGEGGPLLTRFDSDGNVLGAAMVAHIYGADLGAL